MSDPALSQHVATIISRFEAQATVRDHAIAESRQVVRLSANAIRATHRQDHTVAANHLVEAQERLTAMLNEVRTYPSLYWSGYVQDAVKEFAEARITAAIIRGEDIPGPEDIGAEDPAYVNALAEAASELRRQILDLLRHDAFDVDQAEHLFQIMNDIYGQLVTIDFADAMTGGLRRATDQLRGVLERTRGDLTLAVRQQRLEVTLRLAERNSASLINGATPEITPPRS
jgi:translin